MGLKIQISGQFDFILQKRDDSGEDRRHTEPAQVDHRMIRWMCERGYNEKKFVFLKKQKRGNGLIRCFRSFTSEKSKEEAERRCGKREERPRFYWNRTQRQHGE